LSSSARSLNNGILYLMTLPYLIGGIGAVVWWKNKRKPQS
jgi:glucose-6-phosphate dehydrogenase assembly protein OpcA